DRRGDDVARLEAAGFDANAMRAGAEAGLDDGLDHRKAAVGIRDLPDVRDLPARLEVEGRLVQRRVTRLPGLQILHARSSVAEKGDDLRAVYTCRFVAREAVADSRQVGSGRGGERDRR